MWQELVINCKHYSSWFPLRSCFQNKVFLFSELASHPCFAFRSQIGTKYRQLKWYFDQTKDVVWRSVQNVHLLTFTLKFLLWQWSNLFSLTWPNYGEWEKPSTLCPTIIYTVYKVTAAVHNEQCFLIPRVQIHGNIILLSRMLMVMASYCLYGSCQHSSCSVKSGSRISRLHENTNRVRMSYLHASCQIRNRMTLFPQIAFFLRSLKQATASITHWYPV